MFFRDGRFGRDWGRPVSIIVALGVARAGAKAEMGDSLEAMRRSDRHLDMLCEGMVFNVYFVVCRQRYLLMSTTRWA